MLCEGCSRVGPFPVHKRDGSLLAGGVSPLSLLTFFAAAKKVSAAPHRGEANRPLTKQGKANTARNQPKKRRKQTHQQQNPKRRQAKKPAKPQKTPRKPPRSAPTPKYKKTRLLLFSHNNLRDRINNRRDAAHIPQLSRTHPLTNKRIKM